MMWITWINVGLHVFSCMLFYQLSKCPLSPLTGKDWRRCSHSRAHGTWLPEPPGPRRGCCLPCGKTKHLPHCLHCQLPCRLKDSSSGGEPLDLEAFFPAQPYCHSYRNIFTVSLVLIFSSPGPLKPVHPQLAVVSTNFAHCLLSHIVCICFFCMCCCVISEKNTVKSVKSQRIFNSRLLFCFLLWLDMIPSYTQLLLLQIPSIFLTSAG